MRHLAILLIAMTLTSCASSPTSVAVSDVAPNHLAALQGGYHHVESVETGRAYHVYVRLPEGYGASDQSYPTVYLLDGDATFPMLAPAHLLMTYEDKVPEAILVGIAYGSFGEGNKRHLDFTTVATADNPDGGQAERFSAFLGRELLPLIEREYRSSSDRRLLLGNSRAANYVLFDAFTSPDRFWARIASNPSVGPDYAKWHGTPALARRNDLHLFMISGTKDLERTRKNALVWRTAWAGRAAPWTIHNIDIEGGTHAADIPRGYRAALKILFPEEMK